LAMYCDRSDFVNYHRSIGESCDYHAMRDEISLCLFGSHTTFDISDFTQINNHSWDSSSHHASDASNDSHSCDSSSHHSSDVSSGGDSCSTDFY
jgi:hypothetical protein